MQQYLQNFLRFRPLLTELVGRDIKIKYRRSVLGVLWTLLNPLCMMVVMAVVFSNLFRFDVENFPLYLLSGQIVFTFFNESTTSDMTAVLSNASLIKKIYVPKYLFVLSRTASSIINLMASFTALLLVMIAMRAELHWTVLLAPIPLILLIVFCLGMGMLLAALTVKFRDIMHLYSVFTTALMYLTPVFYPLNILPGWLYPIVRWNPVTNYLIMFRNVMLNNTLLDMKSLIVGFVEALVFLLIGVYVFYKRQDTFIFDL